MEIIVVDDGSDDGPALKAALRDVPGVRLVEHSENRGMCAARNSGVRASSGDVVIILDADDEMTPD